MHHIVENGSQGGGIPLGSTHMSANGELFLTMCLWHASHQVFRVIGTSFRLMCHNLVVILVILVCFLSLPWELQGRVVSRLAIRAVWVKPL